jgi:hypothetical protein
MNEIQKSYLLETAKWQKVVGILMAISTALLAVLGVVFICFGSVIGASGLEGFEAFGGAAGAVAGVIYLLCALLYFFFTLYLLRSAKNLKAWGQSDDEEALSNGLKNTKSYFKLNGILAIISFVLIGIVIIVAAIAAIFAA